jgi:hypothetical protein
VVDSGARAYEQTHAHTIAKFGRMLAANVAAKERCVHAAMKLILMMGQ